MSMRYPGGLIAPTPVNQQYPSGVWTGPQSAPYQANNVWANDSSFKNTTLLLHGDGATTPFIKDASTNNFQITLNGDTKPNNLTPFITNGYWSNAFDGSTSYFNIASNAAFGFGTGDFTVEFFIYPNVTANTWSIYHGTTTNSFIINTTSSGNLVIRQYGVTDLFTSASALTVGIWNHVAVSRSGTTISLWLNGSRSSGVTGTNSTNFATTGVYIGRADTATAIVNGWMSNVRTVKGTAVYDPTQTSITVPTSPLTAISGTSLLTCQSNRFVDNSSNAFSLTVNGSPAVSMQQPFTAPSGTSLYGSGYFDGSGDYLAPATSSAFAFGTGDLTFECWIYVPVASDSPIYESRSTNSNTDGFTVTAFSSTVIRVYTNGVLVTATVSNYLNAWTHVAYTRQGSTNRLFVNGVLGATATASDNFSNTTAFIGAGRYASSSISAYFTGYISNVRILKGTAQYTATFTPPTAPLTAITNTSLLTLQTNGPATNNGFLDSSYNSFPVTRNGNPTQGSFAPYGSTWSGYIGASNYLYFANNAALSFGTGDFCVEAWVYKTTAANEAIIDSRVTNNASPWAIYVDGSNFPYFYEGTLYTSTVAITLNAWNHVAVTRSSGTLKVFVNGVQGYSATVTTNLDRSGGNQVIAANVTGGANYWSGYLSNLRIVKGSAVYTSAFTPSTAPLTAISGTSLLTFQSNRFIDNSTNAFALTVVGTPSVQRFAPFAPTVQYTPSTLGGSGYFDGSGDYLNLASNSQTAFQSNNFTIELWVYLTNASANALQTFYSNYTVFATAGSIFFGKHSSNSGAVTFWISGYSTGGPLLAESTLPPGNQWVHYAVTRNGNTFSLYRNGVLSTSSTAYTGAATISSNPNYIGVPGDATNNYFFNGYMSDFRVVNGTAVYTGTFTPPTAPLAPIANTALLLPYTNAAIFDNSGMNDLETVGNAQISTSVVKYGTSSMYFDGSGDYLLAKSNDVFNFGTGDFTVEFWINASASGSYTQTIGTLVSGTEAGTWRVGNRYNGLNQIYFARGTGSGFNEFQANVNVNDGAWHHVAVVRYSGTVTIYADGVARASSSITGTCTSSNPLYLGYNGRDNAYITGYLDDVRVTKGVARYITNFTPPVARMPNQ